VKARFARGAESPKCGSAMDTLSLPDPQTFARADQRPAGWAVSRGLIAYPQAVEEMEARALAIADGEGEELVWLLEHPPLYTAGVSAKPGDLLQPGRLPVFQSGRGGQFTYHGPGQRIAYVMLDLRARRRDVHAFVAALEAWVIRALAELGVRGELRAGRVGVWVTPPDPPGDAKIAALGVRLKRWVSLHGVSLNVDPDLTQFEGIVPCGIRDGGVTSLSRLGAPSSLAEVDSALLRAFTQIFGPVKPVAPPCGA
jgi:lipoyl(octanoyl) transferase